MTTGALTSRLEDRRVFALLGEVVDGNPTQEMLEAAFDAAGLPWSYISLPIENPAFERAVGAARTLGFAGLHITKPYKVRAVPLVDRMTDAAARIGAVNCIFRDGSDLVGDNTDGRRGRSQPYRRELAARGRGPTIQRGAHLPCCLRRSGAT